MTLRKSNFFENALFRPSVIRNGNSKTTMTLADSEQNSYGAVFTSSSFRFDPEGAPLKNTQQLNVDFSKFENHTFFNSAKNKVQVAFEKIINQYPFDGTRKEYEQFFDKISGFEKYVFNEFPKHAGFLIFDRNGSDPGTHLLVNEKEISSDAAKKKPLSERLPLSIGSKPFTFEMKIFVPSGSVNQNEVIAQRLHQNRGYTLALSDSSGLTSGSSECDLMLILSDGSKSEAVTSRIQKGKFVHVAAMYDRGNTDKLKIVLDGEKTTHSEGSLFLSKFDFDNSMLTIGSGTEHQYISDVFTPKQTLSGALDDFRYFDSARLTNDIRNYKDREIFAQSDLKLYFKFNEPSGSYEYGNYGNENLCLDHSGFGMHTKIQNFQMNQRDINRISARSLPKEDKENSPVLFPAFETVRQLSDRLLQSATNYDYNNPNLITNLVPTHYLVDEQNYFGLTTDQQSLEAQPGISQNQPGGNKLQQAELIGSVLFLWAETFDQIKLFIDEFSRLLKTDYKTEGTISDQLLPYLAKYYDIELPSQFNAATVEQTLQGRNVSLDAAQTNRSLQDIQNIVWRRILSDLPNIRKYKGTRSSLEASLRNIGINPGTTFRIREYGGNPRKEIENSYEKRTHMGKTMRFSGSLNLQGSIDGEGRDSKRPLVTSGYLSGSRVEPGFPPIVGSFVDGKSDNPNDGLFTSGSWHCAGTFNFPGKIRHKQTQSLMRLQTTGSSGGVGNSWLTFNVVANKPDLGQGVTGSLVLYGKPDGSSTDTIKIQINDIDLFDGQKWTVSFGRKIPRKDDNILSSSYYLYAGKSRFVKEPLLLSASAYIGDITSNSLNSINTEYNASGSYVAIGSMSLGYDSTSPLSFLNQSTETAAKTVNFSGNATNLRFFSKDMSKEEVNVHVENPKSLGVKMPNLNYGFVEHESGSFEKLRFDYDMKQEVTGANSLGNIKIFDFSQNNLIGTGTGFEPEAEVIVPARFDYRILSPKLDIRSSENKVRVRSYKDPDRAEREGVAVAPLYNLPPDEKPYDDKRVEVEVSTAQALNDDIILLFSSLDYFDNAIGDPELVFASEYKSLRSLRRIYFNRLTEKMSLSKFFSFFKWFDDTVGDVLEGLVPRSSKFLGTNFIIESHSLERNKFDYKYTDMYLGELERPNPGEIYVKQIVGLLKKR